MLRMLLCNFWCHKCVYLSFFEVAQEKVILLASWLLFSPCWFLSMQQDGKHMFVWTMAFSSAIRTLTSKARCFLLEKCFRQMACKSLNNALLNTAVLTVDGSVHSYVQVPIFSPPRLHCTFTFINSAALNHMFSHLVSAWLHYFKAAFRRWFWSRRLHQIKQWSRKAKFSSLFTEWLVIQLCYVTESTTPNQGAMKVYF